MSAQKGNNKKREDSPEKKAYIKTVKRRLNAALERTNLAKSAVHPLLEEAYGFNLNAGTVRELLNEKSFKGFDAMCIVSICQLFGFDFNKILEPIPVKENIDYYEAAEPEYRKEEYIDLSIEKEGLNAEKAFIESLRQARGKFRVLNDDDYIGTFYGFVTPQKRKTPRPTSFTLVMKRDKNGLMMAELTSETEEFYRNPKTKKKEPVLRVYHGVPVFTKANRAVIIMLSSDDNLGEYWILGFAYQEFKTRAGLIFKQGILLNGENPDGAELGAENFVLFNKQLDKDKLKYIPGLLKAPNRMFTVSVEEAMKLAEEEPEVAAFLQAAEPILNIDKEQVYTIDEETLLHTKSIKMEKYERAKALLLLKEKSYVASAYHFRAKMRYTGFGVNYLAETESGDLELEDGSNDTEDSKTE